MSINLDSLTVSNTGRVSFSGLSSGIDFEAAVEAIVKAKRIPVDRLETRLTEGETKIAAYQEFHGLLNGLKDSLKNLYGAVTADNSKNIFEAKQAFASSSRTDSGAKSAPTDLVGVTVSNRAAAGSHTIEVVQTAASHRVGSGTITSRSADLGTALGLGGPISGTIEIAGREIAVLSTDSLQDLADRINNANTGKDATGVSASIVQVASDRFVLNLKADQAGKTMGTAPESDIVLADPDGILGQIGILSGDGGFANELQAARKAQFYADGILGDDGQPLLIERDSNTISDLFAGVTLNLFKAEPGTTVQIDIERNLTQVKSAITGFVEAYNETRSFLNFHLDTDPSTGKPKEDAVLFGSRTLADVESRLGQLLGEGAAGTDDAFKVLAQIGINFAPLGGQNPELANTLQIDDQKLDEALLNNLDDVRKLFGFSFSSSDPRVVLLGFEGATGYSGSGYQLSIGHDGSGITSASTNDGTARVNGKQITVESGGAKGLKLLYTGDSPANVQIDFTVGLGAGLFFELENMLDSKTGIVEGEINELTTVNKQSQTRIDEMLVRLELQRESLLQRFVRMEASLASMNRILESIGQMTDAMFGQKK